MRCIVAPFPPLRHALLQGGRRSEACVPDVPSCRVGAVTVHGRSLVLWDAENDVGVRVFGPRSSKTIVRTDDCCGCAGVQPPAGGVTQLATSVRNATWLILPVVICLSQRLSHACVSMN